MAKAGERKGVCRRGHRLVLGKTAYAVTRWSGRELFLLEDDGGLLTGCDGTQCKYGGPAEHALLEGAPGEGGTRVVGRTTAGATVWQHRMVELRCRACNRRRVAEHRSRSRRAGS